MTPRRSPRPWPSRTPALVTALAIACAPAAPPPAPQPGVGADVAFLASQRLEGRAPGTRGSDSAAAFIARRYEQLGLRGAFRADCRGRTDCGVSYFQRFNAQGTRAQNVAAVVPGTDPALRDQYVVIGAHYDHLGRSPRFALDSEAGDVVRPGADDNASGTAGVLELAQRLAARPTRRSVLLVHFDAEEVGLVGSGTFVRRPPVPNDSVVLMVNLDMIGRLGRDRLIVDLSSGDAALGTLVDSAAQAVGVRTVRSRATAGRSDHASFGDAGIRAVALFTGFHDDYHRRTDVAARIDVPGLLRVVSVAEGLVRLVGGRDPR